MAAIRKHGSYYEPFYIGETADLRVRLRQHLETVKIVDVLRGLDNHISKGARYFHFGYLIGKHKQADKRSIVQNFLIEKALAENIKLLNKKLTAVPTHTLI